MSTRPMLEQLRRLFPVVVRGRVAVLLLVDLLLVLTILIVTLVSGAPPSEVLTSCLILPGMLLITLCGADSVATLRSSGDLELVVTLASPGRAIVARVLPIWLLALLQVALIALVLITFMPAWQVLLGLLHTLLPLVFAAVATLYAALRTRGPGAAMLLALLLMIIAMLWIDHAELLRESENATHLTLLQVLLSALRCQLGLLLASLCLAALARRRLERPEQLLEPSP